MCSDFLVFICLHKDYKKGNRYNYEKCGSSFEHRQHLYCHRLKCMGVLYMKNHLYRCWGCLFLWKWIETLNIDKTASKKIGASSCSMKFAIKKELRPKTHPSFYGIILMILWIKSLVQHFAVLWSILTKLCRYEGFNPVWVTSYTQMYKTFHPLFSLHIFVNFMENRFLQFYVSFWPFLMNLWSCKGLNNYTFFWYEWCHTHKWEYITCSLWLTCKLLEVVDDVVLF